MALISFSVIGAALTLNESGAHSRVALISTMSKTLRGIQRELSEVHTGYAQFNIKYVHLELLYEPSFKS